MFPFLRLHIVSLFKHKSCPQKRTSIVPIRHTHLNKSCIISQKENKLHVQKKPVSHITK